MKGIPEKFKVDFSPYREKDLVQQAVTRLLSQHYDKCTIKEFTLALMGEVHCLYNALIDLMEGRTLYAAEGENLNALGRIVGEEREFFQYREGAWLTADRAERGVDAAGTFCLRGVAGSFISGPDPEYARRILWRIARNHCLASSVPELAHLARSAGLGVVSFEKTGPMQATLLIPSDLAQSAWNTLTRAGSDKLRDDMFALPYPATFHFYSVITWHREQPENLDWFCADRGNIQRCDRARCACGIPLPERDDGAAHLVSPDAEGGTAAIYLPQIWLCADRTNKQRCDAALCAAGAPYK